MIEPSFGSAPLSFNRRRREPQDFGSLLDRQAAEELQLHDSALLRIDLSQSFERVIEGNDIRRSLLRYGQGFIQRDLAGAAATLGVSMAARMIDQDAAHQVRGDGE